jgi:hypothetical protein
MRLTVEEHREAIKRYGHIRPARGLRASWCATRCPGTTRTCTRDRGHSGPHVAHGFLRRVLAVWDAGAAVGPRREAGRPVSGARARGGGLTRRPVGLRTRSPPGILETFRRIVVRAAASADEIFFIILFIIFVKLAIDVLLSLG